MRLGQWISLLALCLSVYVLWQIRQVLLLVFAGIVVATILNRVVRLLRRLHIKRGFAIAITILLLMAILAGFFAIILPRLIDQFQQLSIALPPALEELQAGYNWLQGHIPGQMLADDRNFSSLIQSLKALASRLVGNFFSIIGSSISIVVRLLLFIAITVMLLVNPLQYRRVLILAFPAFYRPRVNEILDECEVSLVGWIKGTLISMSVIALLSYIGLLILGVPLPLVNALLAGLLEFIPNVGPTLSVVPPALLGLLDAPWKALATVGVYILIQQFESLVLVPAVMKHEVSLLPLFTIISVVVFSLLFGFLGLFLAVSLLIVLQIWLKEVVVNDILNPWQQHPTPHQQELLTTRDHRSDA